MKELVLIYQSLHDLGWRYKECWDRSAWSWSPSQVWWMRTSGSSCSIKGHSSGLWKYFNSAFVHFRVSSSGKMYNIHCYWVLPLQTMSDLRLLHYFQYSSGKHMIYDMWFMIYDIWSMIYDINIYIYTYITFLTLYLLLFNSYFW